MLPIKTLLLFHLVPTSCQAILFIVPRHMGFIPVSGPLHILSSACGVLASLFSYPNRTYPLRTQLQFHLPWKSLPRSHSLVNLALCFSPAWILITQSVAQGLVISIIWVLVRKAKSRTSSHDGELDKCCAHLFPRPH